MLFFLRVKKHAFFAYARQRAYGSPRLASCILYTTAGGIWYTVYQTGWHLVYCIPEWTGIQYTSHMLRRTRYAALHKFQFTLTGIGTV
jgi:hypothetical protein